MIVLGFLTGLITFNNFIFSLFPELPQVPTDIETNINYVLTIIFQHIGLLNLFIPLRLVLILLPICIVIQNFNLAWSFINWVWCHIPIFGASK